MCDLVNRALTCVNELNIDNEAIDIVLYFNSSC